MEAACLDVEPHALRATSSALAALVCLLSLNSVFGATWHFSRRALRALFDDLERRAMLLQYALFLPLFEVFVVWGSRVDAHSIAHSCSTTLLVHIIVAALSLAIICVAQFALIRFRPLLHVAQCCRIAVCILVLCDRGVRGVLGYEAFFVALVLGCALFEVAHVNVIVFDERSHIEALREARREFGGLAAGGAGDAALHAAAPETDAERAERRAFVGSVLGAGTLAGPNDTPRQRLNGTPLRDMLPSTGRKHTRTDRRVKRSRALRRARERLSTSFSSLPQGGAKDKVKRSDQTADEDEDELSSLVDSTTSHSGFDTSTALTDGFASEVPAEAREHFLLQKSEERIAQALMLISRSEPDAMNERQLRRLLRKVQTILQRAGVGTGSSHTASHSHASATLPVDDAGVRRRAVPSSDSEVSDF